MIEPGSRVLIRETGETAWVWIVDARCGDGHGELGNDAYVALVTEKTDRLTAVRFGDLEEISATAPSELPANFAIGLRLIEGKKD